ncbi:MAG: transposase, partial [Clostridiaceae bacterium]|nr:transposase [Clostridiaceae bacterium]
MKVTIRAVLINIDEEKQNIINNLMTVFCSAVRYSFNRVLEGIKLGDIEKSVASKYGLNIRQSKDAVENARQTIVSQKELVKLNYGNYLKKTNNIQNVLNDS